MFSQYHFSSSSYLLYEPNHALRALKAASMPYFHIFDPKGKMVQNIIFFLVNQNSISSLKLNLTHQHESRDMLSFQNKVPDIKILKFQAN